VIPGWSDNHAANDRYSRSDNGCWNCTVWIRRSGRRSRMCHGSGDGTSRMPCWSSCPAVGIASPSTRSAWQNGWPPNAGVCRRVAL